jgi:hypothetical protein
MGYIWIISEYGGNKGGIRVGKKHPVTQQFLLALLRGEILAKINICCHKKTTIF